MYEKQINQWLKEHGMWKGSVLRRDFLVNYEKGYVEFPINDINGNFLFNKKRMFTPGSPKFLYDKGAFNVLYGAEFLKDNKEVIITEGESQVLHLRGLGKCAVSSTAGALSFKEEWGELFKDKIVTICMDQDEAGARGTYKILSAIPDCSVMFLPSDCKDYSEHLYKFMQNPDNYRDHYPNVIFPSINKTTKKKHVKSLSLLIKDIRSNLHELPYSKEYWDAFLDEALKDYKRLTAKKPKIKIDTTDVRNIPIENFLTFNRQGFANCFWHIEKTPSLHKVPNSNVAHCFGCDKTADVIDVVMQQQNMKFIDAVNYLKS